MGTLRKLTLGALEKDRTIHCCNPSQSFLAASDLRYLDDLLKKNGTSEPTSPVDIQQKSHRKHAIFYVTRAFQLFGLGLLLTCTACDQKKDQHTYWKASGVEKPNIIVILTDQERYPTHWPKEWAEQNLHATNRLKKHGLTFNRAYTAACQCTPSRAVIYTSNHYPINTVASTPPKGEGLPSDDELIDIGSVLTQYAGYDVIWKGKWHLSPPLEGDYNRYNWTQNDINHLQTRYDLSEWNPPDAGRALTADSKKGSASAYDVLRTLGGGWANNDGRFLQGMTPFDEKQTPGFGESILEYIRKVAKVPQSDRKPFCIFISFVNPHDVWVYPNYWDKVGYKKEDFQSLGISLPDNYKDDLSTKPSIQRRSRDAYNQVAPLKNGEEEKEYVNFYAYLHQLVDSQVGAVLDALDQAGLTQDTIIIRTADHGELGLSHGMREKDYTVYEEMVHIPFIVSNPKIFPDSQTTEAFYSHLDLLPTIAELAHVPNFAKYGKGTSLVPVFKDPSSSVQDAILFTYDDSFCLSADTPGGHIRGVREGDWTYAVYYSENASDFEYEMYNIKRDPGQLQNLLHGDVTAEDAVEARRLHEILQQKIDHTQALPAGFAWPKSPF